MVESSKCFLPRTVRHLQIFYNVVQGFCYTVMALMIMRLKLLMNPHLCILAAVVANGKVGRKHL